MDISVVVPVFGCRAALLELYQRLTRVLSQCTQSYEIVLVNDDCPQNSWELIEQICNNDRKVIGVEMARNFGQMKAITAGIDLSAGDWIVVMDCDLQDSPEEIPRLYEKAQEGFDVVFARRIQRHDPLFQRILSLLFYRVYSAATDGRYDPTISNFSIISRQVADEYCSMREMHRAYGIYIKWLGFRHGYIDVHHHERHSGKSSYTWKKRLDYAFEILTSESDKLLRLIMIIGLWIAFLSFIMVIITVFRYFFLHIPQGYTSLFAAIFMMGGLILVAIGVVGIYIGNIYMETKHRPLYVIRTILNADDQEGRQMNE